MKCIRDLFVVIVVVASSQILSSSLSSSLPSKYAVSTPLEKMTAVFEFFTSPTKVDVSLSTLTYDNKLVIYAHQLCQVVDDIEHDKERAIASYAIETHQHINADTLEQSSFVAKQAAISFLKDIAKAEQLDIGSYLDKDDDDAMTIMIPPDKHLTCHSSLSAVRNFKQLVEKALSILNAEDAVGQGIRQTWNTLIASCIREIQANHMMMQLPYLFEYKMNCIHHDNEAMAGVLLSATSQLSLGDSALPIEAFREHVQCFFTERLIISPDWKERLPAILEEQKKKRQTLQCKNDK